MTEKLRITSVTLLLLISLTTPLAAQDEVDYIIRWQPNPEPYVTEYIIYRSLIPDISGFVAIDSVPAGTHTYTDIGLSKGTRYYYRLVAKNGNTGDRSSFSNPVSGLAIPQDASDSMKDLCRITNIDSVYINSYDITWSTIDQTIGFVQYDTDMILDLMSEYDDQYSTNHTRNIDSLETLQNYYVRAVSYDNNDNMTLSTVETLETGELPAPPTAPQLSIYPVPYHPNMGSLNFGNLPKGGSIIVFNENGLEVWQKDIGTETSITWDGLNQQGSPVMSGVYYVIVKDARGNVTERRPIMIERQR